ncbi:MAG: 16S rRNA (cytosine(1402)-N(4))-methyltransferase [Verrucomicrobia bacterium]|nr:MAG: 16S rRNA (cytosine(1402)-N(4))-methyltransferase [Verrucomicrobiota bacterium]
MAHSVSDHLHVMIADYDRFIRTVIPHYETMRAVQLELLARSLPPDGRVIDLGGGTGALARAVAEKFPGVRVEIWDTDPAMLEVARERCAAFGDRVHFVERSFAEPLPACDAVVACIALHHVKDISAKGKIYANIFQALRPGGIFANADCVMSETPRRSRLNCVCSPKPVLPNRIAFGERPHSPSSAGCGPEPVRRDPISRPRVRGCRGARRGERLSSTPYSAPGRDDDCSDVISGFLDCVQRGVDLGGIQRDETEHSFRETEFSAAHEVH